MEEYLNIQKMILKAEEPFYNGTELVFPRVQLVKMLEDKSINPSVYQKYANEILLRNNQNKEESIKVGDKVQVLKAIQYNGQPFKTYYNIYDVIEVKGDRIVIGIGQTVTCAINKNNIRKV